MDIEKDTAATIYAGVVGIDCSFDDMAPLCGVARSKTEWHKTSLDWNDAESLGGVDSILRSIESLADLLAADGYGRVIGPECSERFQVLNGDVLLGIHTALQRLVEDGLQELDRTRERLVPTSR